jgi:plastocyanin
MPLVTRTGEVKDIIIGERLSAGELAVNAGDEVRWVNTRSARVRVMFLDPITDKQLSCRDNFGGWMTPSDTAILDTNESASACFRDPGYVRYTVRMKSGTPGGEMNVAGVVKVGGVSSQSTGMSSQGTGMNGSVRSGETKSTITTTTTTITTPSK